MNERGNERASKSEIEGDKRKRREKTNSIANTVCIALQLGLLNFQPFYVAVFFSTPMQYKLGNSIDYFICSM